MESRKEIFTSDQIDQFYTPDDWEYRSFSEINSIILDKGFPCHFARISESKGSLYYSFFDSLVRPENIRQLADRLVEFTERVKLGRGKNRYALLSVCKPEEAPRDNNFYEKNFWNLLNDLHEIDEEAWPKNVSTDPNDGDFEFCFNGTSLFTFANTPFYKRRKSRNLGKSFVVVFVPAASFWGVKLLTPGGISARREIRERIKIYDGAEHYFEFGKEDEGIPLSWKSYFIPDDDVPISTSCPFKFRYRKDTFK